MCHYNVFESEKLVWQDISYHSRICIAAKHLIPDNTCFALETTDKWVLAVLNSPATWCWLSRNAIHGKDEALRLKSIYTERIPIPDPDEHSLQIAGETVLRLIEITAAQQQTQRTLLDWLRMEYAVEKPSDKLQAVAELDSDTLVTEVKRIRGKKLPLTAAGVQGLREEYTRTIEPARALAAETLKLECALSDLVNQAYGLTPEEIELMWKTAPPRMPIPPPQL